MKRYYIAYGSNLNVRQMKYRCPTSKIVGTAIIKDYELLYKGSKTGSYLTIEKKKGSLVPVVVWEVTAADEHSLDIYEGCPNFYYKENMKIRLSETGKTVECGRGSRLYSAGYDLRPSPEHCHERDRLYQNLFRLSGHGIKDL